MRKLLILSVVLPFAVAACNGGSEGTPSSRSETTYERVIRTGTLRAGYVNYPPSLIIDPNSKQMSGAFFDILNKIGDTLQLRVEYVEEVGWATMLQGLENGRYDITGQATWANPTRGKLATLSTPVYFSGIGVWVRPDETRFSSDSDWASLNERSVRIGAIDGSTPALIARTQFPSAQLVTYPDLTSESQLFLDVVAGRLDIFFAEPSVGATFLASNPGSVKNVATEAPVRVFANVFVMARGEQQLKMMIDTAIHTMQNSGELEPILRKYESTQKLFYRVRQPFEGR